MDTGRAFVNIYHCRQGQRPQTLLRSTPGARSTETGGNNGNFLTNLQSVIHSTLPTKLIHHTISWTTTYPNTENVFLCVEAMTNC